MGDRVDVDVNLILHPMNEVVLYYGLIKIYLCRYRVKEKKL